MASHAEEVEDLVGKEYEHGFVTDIDSDTVEPGLNEDAPDPPLLGTCCGV